MFHCSFGFGAKPQRVLSMSHICKHPKWLLQRAIYSGLSSSLERIQLLGKSCNRSYNPRWKPSCPWGTSQRPRLPLTDCVSVLCACRGNSVRALWHCHLCERLQVTFPTLVSGAVAKPCISFQNHRHSQDEKKNIEEHLGKAACSAFSTNSSTARTTQHEGSVP